MKEIFLTVAILASAMPSQAENGEQYATYYIGVLYGSAQVLCDLANQGSIKAETARDKMAKTYQASLNDKDISQYSGLMSEAYEDIKDDSCGGVFK